MKNMTIKRNTSSNETLMVAQLMQAPFATGSLIVNFSQNQITLDGEELILQPKVLELLVNLCAANGTTLSKQELIDRLWPDTIVGPESLANTMARLRKTLNDDAKNPLFIKTVQRKGYLWLPSVVPVKEDKKAFNIKSLMMVSGVFVVAVLLYIFAQPEPEEFPFPDLSIQKLEGGGYEIEVGIDGELTEEKKVAMLKELKRITGEEYSGMEFTVDPVAPECANKSTDNNKQHCEDKKIKP
jgi:DNA-binding winged helix-turn-helix (wHTH) protein